jgi:vacuolar-type H+-ATPase subunit I/STV1
VAVKPKKSSRKGKPATRKGTGASAHKEWEKWTATRLQSQRQLAKSEIKNASLTQRLNQMSKDKNRLSAELEQANRTKNASGFVENMLEKERDQGIVERQDSRRAVKDCFDKVASILQTSIQRSDRDANTAPRFTTKSDLQSANEYLKTKFSGFASVQVLVDSSEEDRQEVYKVIEDITTRLFIKNVVSKNINKITC